MHGLMIMVVLQKEISWVESRLERYFMRTEIICRVSKIEREDRKIIKGIFDLLWLHNNVY